MNGKLTGMAVVYGLREIKPIDAPQFKGFRMKLRMRSGKLAKLFVRTFDGVREFYLENCGDTWKPHEIGRNVHLK
jgi:hypothetical protein